jgi:hypothetical protein
MNGERVLIDTSVWISYFREGGDSDPLSARMDSVLDSCEVFVPKVVIAELIQGAKSDKEVSVIRDFVEAFHIIDQGENTWLRAGELSYSMRRKGVSVSLIDCYIAILASDHGCAVFSLDDHFKSIRRFLRIELFPG